MRLTGSRLIIVLLLLVVGVAPGCVGDTGAAAPRAAPKTPVLAYYYLWWSSRHWIDRLGTNYPITNRKLPIPAATTADGCNPYRIFPGAQITDVPLRLTSQDNPAVVASDVRAAAAAGLSGFVVNWRGTGRPNQTLASVSYNRRLQYLVEAVHALNAGGTPFKLWLSYKSSDTRLSGSYIRNDLDYLRRTYQHDSAFANPYGSGRPVLIWMGSRKYPAATLAAISLEFHSSFYLVGDENWRTWAAHGRYFDADQYYWSSQNPTQNPHSFVQMRRLAAMVRHDGKRWFAPFAPGFDAQLLGQGHGCVPRNNGETMRALYHGNAASNPDAMLLISWNEVAEGTYVEPLQRWGDLYLRILRPLITGAGAATRPPP